MNFSGIEICRRKCFLLGPARFVNHDCAPNAVLFDLSDQWTVEVRATQNIQPCGEITVDYGPNYFGRGNGSCLCKTCENKGRNGWDSKISRDQIARSYIPRVEKPAKRRLSEINEEPPITKKGRQQGLALDPYKCLPEPRQHSSQPKAELLGDRDQPLVNEVFQDFLRPPIHCPSRSKPKGVDRLAGSDYGKLASNGAEHGANAENPIDVDSILPKGEDGEDYLILVDMEETVATPHSNSVDRNHQVLQATDPSRNRHGPKPSGPSCFDRRLTTDFDDDPERPNSKIKTLGIGPRRELPKRDRKPTMKQAMLPATFAIFSSLSRRRMPQSHPLVVQQARWYGDHEPRVLEKRYPRTKDAFCLNFDCRTHWLVTSGARRSRLCGTCQTRLFLHAKYLPLSENDHERLVDWGSSDLNEAETEAMNHLAHGYAKSDDLLFGPDSNEVQQALRSCTSGDGSSQSVRPFLPLADIVEGYHALENERTSMDVEGLIYEEFS